MGGGPGKFCSHGCLGFMRGTLSSSPMELGGALFGPPGVGCRVEPSLRPGSLDRIHGGGIRGLLADRSVGELPFPAALLARLVGWFVGGFDAFLSFDQHRGLVGFARLRKKLGGLGPGFDPGLAGISAHLDFFSEFGDLRLGFYPCFRGRGGVVGSSVPTEPAASSCPLFLPTGPLSGSFPAYRYHCRHARSASPFNDGGHPNCR